MSHTGILSLMSDRHSETKSRDAISRWNVYPQFLTHAFSNWQHQPCTQT